MLRFLLRYYYVFSTPRNSVVYASNSSHDAYVYFKQQSMMWKFEYYIYIWVMIINSHCTVERTIMEWNTFSDSSYECYLNLWGLTNQIVYIVPSYDKHLSRHNYLWRHFLNVTAALQRAWRQPDIESQFSPCHQNFSNIFKQFFLSSTVLFQPLPLPTVPK